MVNLSRKTKLIAGTISLLSLLCLCYSYFVEPFRLVVNRPQIAIDGWNQEFNGFRAVLISDIHGGANGGDAESISRIVETANDQDADAVFLLGDYVSQQRKYVTNSESPLRMPISEVADILGDLKARYGVFAVLGNHDGWYGDKAITGELQRVGIKVLDGDVATVEENGSRLRILGLRDHLHVDTWRSFSNEAKQLLAPTEGTGNVIVLEHSPDVIDMVTGDLSISNETKIMFAGHTHGGQVWLPIFGAPIVPSNYGQKYAAGHIVDRGIEMFVTTGTGTSILPFRFLVPPEIAVVTLKSK
jgi:predicted MPP superfamily phosphohydrolase